MNTETSISIIKNPIGEGLQLSKIDINEDYCKKWNIIQKDFVCLTMDGELLRQTLYRVGGFGGNIKDDYFMLLKHVEAFYDNNITRDIKKKPHLESRWCILNKHGDEKVEFKQFSTPYLVNDSCIYSINSKYYNIETKEFYCYTNRRVESRDFLFLENDFDKDESKRGVLKIEKKNGKQTLFK